MDYSKENQNWDSLCRIEQNKRILYVYDVRLSIENLVIVTWIDLVDILGKESKK